MDRSAHLGATFRFSGSRVTMTVRDEGDKFVRGLLRVPGHGNIGVLKVRKYDLKPPRWTRV
jgi:hypothetical protein